MKHFSAKLDALYVKKYKCFFIFSKYLCVLIHYYKEHGKINKGDSIFEYLILSSKQNMEVALVEHEADGRCLP